MLPCICPVIDHRWLQNAVRTKKKVAHEAIVSRSTIILRRRKVEFIKWINLRNILFVRFVKFEIMQWCTVYQDQFCVWLSLARLPTAGIFFFLSHFFKKETALSFFFLPDFCFLYLFNALIATIHFVLIFSQSCKILSNFSKLSAILKHRGKNFVVVASTMHLSSKRL